VFGVECREKEKEDTAIGDYLKSVKVTSFLERE
jgi:hypothetical protein